LHTPVSWPRLAALLEKYIKIDWLYARKVDEQSVEESEDLESPSLESLGELKNKGIRPWIIILNRTPQA
jgi:hypothetical protein